MQDADQHAASSGGQRKPRQRIRGGTQPLLRSQVILQQAHKAKPVTQYKPPRKINNASNKEAVKRQAKFSAIPGENRSRSLILHPLCARVLPGIFNETKGGLHCGCVGIFPAIMTPSYDVNTGFPLPVYH